MTTYKFVDSFNPTPDDEQTDTFLQIAGFEHPKSKRYHVRKFNVFQSELTNMKDYYLSKRKYDKLLKIRKPHTFKVYSVYSLNDVNPPNMTDILNMRSTMLQSNHTRYGFAPF